MAGITSIEWTDRSWNPTSGCTRATAGCSNCYAFALHDMRYEAVQRGAKLPKQYSKPFSEIQLFPERLRTPLSWRTPQKIFVNSMSDLFHSAVPDAFIAQVFEIMNQAHWHTFQILTKRPARAARMAGQLTWSPNIWMGTSIESDQVVGRADLLRRIPAAIRFISAEPLLGEPTHLNLEGIHWLIVGAESGRDARPMDLDWARFLRNRCQDEGVAFFLKQFSVNGHKVSLPQLDGRVWQEFPVMLNRCPFCQILFERSAQTISDKSYYEQSRAGKTPACDVCAGITCGDTVEKVKADIDKIGEAFNAWLAE